MSLWMLLTVFVLACFVTMDTPKILGLVAVFLAAVNIFGGFTVSHRMLLMFKKKEKK